MTRPPQEDRKRGRESVRRNDLGLDSGEFFCGPHERCELSGWPESGSRVFPLKARNDPIILLLRHRSVDILAPTHELSKLVKHLTMGEPFQRFNVGLWGCSICKFKQLSQIQ
ncbi:hypothetical protein CEXT_18591 [Caerostris extrusa]|uniref:Uncharacterized protein n=1 Tax=Caerostris extrusa TaxID=172846 RepID=A0AAV4RFI9_CAEEX|nr:hypothetical protein CEXT_18591 [Caerostris extrusa]